MRFPLVAFSLSLSLSLACIGEDLDADTKVVAAIGGCGPSCGTNSPIVDGVPFPDLALDGVTRNSYGAKLVGVLSPAGARLKLSVRDDRLYVQAPGNPWTLALQKNSTIVINLPIAGKNENVELFVADVSTTKHWVDPGADKAPIYRLMFEDVVGERHDLCPTPDSPPPSSQQQNMPESYMFAFGGNKFDHAQKTVAKTRRAADGWVNFACEGGAIAKLHLTRHTRAGRNAGHSASMDDIQTLLKMFVADYCGDGSANTVHGQVLRYTDDNGWFDVNNFYAGPFLDNVSVEAIWDADGAVCLSDPRYYAYEEIKCDEELIPKCTAAQEAGWDTLGHLISANPI